MIFHPNYWVCRCENNWLRPNLQEQCIKCDSSRAECLPALADDVPKMAIPELSTGYFTSISYELWKDIFVPISDECGTPILFETNNHQISTVRIDLIWTLCAEGETNYIDAGKRWVNRIGYYIGQVIYPHNNIQVSLGDD